MPSDTNSKIIYDHIYLTLVLIKLQSLIIEEILDHGIKNKSKMFLNLDKQLLLYVKSKDRTKKNRVINTIKMGFTLFSRRRKLVISTPTNFIANDIIKSTVYTVIGISS